MKVKMIIPRSGMGIDEAIVVRWLKSEGEKVALDEPIVEIETAKSTQEVGPPAAGTLQRILLAAGEIAPVGTAIAEIDVQNG